MNTQGENLFAIWRDSAIYVGTSFETHMHSHHAVQCCIALEGSLQIKWPEVDEWKTVPAAIIGSDISHNIRCNDGPVCLLYLEKKSSCYRTILDFHSDGTDLHTKQPILLNTIIPQEFKQNVSQTLSLKLNCIGANKIKHDILHLFSGYFQENRHLDQRISRLLSVLHESPSTNFRGQDLARKVNLSESRMQHLFKEQMGLPIRRYILWMRLRSVLELSLTGVNLTDAAHSSGFSDSAHFSRTFRTMFGIPPSVLLNRDARLNSLFCEM
ncbi:helix-turn-helix domain-containing protein [Aliikangiella sp. IMCC44359]|uniref:helix-turn-helix domain-containing protein n=1 Tax=Aliikangiella sp. IMCC44359 TaxID=3459125 RepID=UPI00403A8D1E